MLLLYPLVFSCQEIEKGVFIVLIEIVVTMQIETVVKMLIETVVTMHLS